MRILLSNDDGYLAPGLRALAHTLATIAQVTVVAPSRNRSGASNSLTLEFPLRTEAHDNGFISVDGTPTDCVHLAITGLLQEEPDLVVAGVNAGANLGDDVLYSGTVAAAVEGRFLGLPAIAVSLVGHEHQHYATAAQLTLQVVQRLNSTPLPPNTILNINVPDLPLDKIKGFAVTRLGNRHKSEPVIKMKDPRGRPIYWVGPAGPEQDAGPGTDFYAIKQGMVSITPIQVDMTDYKAMDTLSRWVEAMPTT